MVVARHDLSEHLLDAAVHLDPELVAREGGHSRERRRLVAEPLKAGIRGRPASAGGTADLQEREGVRPFDGQRSQQHGIDEREQRRGGADPDRERGDRGHREARRAHEQAPRIRDVLHGIVQQADATRVAALVGDQARRPEGAARRAPGLGLVQAPGPRFPGKQLQMQVQLARQITLDSVRPEERAQAEPEFAQVPHHDLTRSG